METFTDLKELVDNPHYPVQRAKNLGTLNDEKLDDPIIAFVNGFNKLPYCFTLQSCYGHFVYRGKDLHNLDPLPTTNSIKTVKYRIAYISFCIEDSSQGRTLLAALEEIPPIDPDNIQFGCAEWFWERQVNSYALQVEPNRFKHQDTAILEHPEALLIEKVRDRFFAHLGNLLAQIDARQNRTDILLK